MPTKRLPWFKVWVGATRHEKVATLSDADFRTWVELLDAASQQHVRGKFESLSGAAAVTRRPAASIKRLVGAGLLDDRQGDGLWLHDWNDWQRWRPEDGGNDTESSPEPPTINTRSTHDQPPNVNGTTSDQHVIRSATTHDRASRAAERAKREKEKEKEKETESKTEPLRGGSAGAPPLSTGEPVPKPRGGNDLVADLITAIHGLDPKLVIHGDRARAGALLKRNPDTDVGVVAAAYVAFHHGEWPGSNWLRQNGALWCAVEDVGGYVQWQHHQVADTAPPGLALPPRSARFETCAACGRRGRFIVADPPLCDGCADARAAPPRQIVAA